MSDPTMAQIQRLLLNPPSGAEFRARRQGAGLTLDALAERSGVSEKTIRNVEVGERRVTPQVIARLVVVPELGFLDEASAKQTDARARGLAAVDPEKRKQIAGDGGRAVHKQGRGHVFTPEEARKVAGRGGEACRDKHPEHHGSAGKTGGYSRGLRFLSKYECYLLSWLASGKVVWQALEGSTVWLSDQAGAPGDSRSFHREAERLLKRRLLAVKIDKTTRLFYLTDGGRISARLLEKQQLP